MFKLTKSIFYEKFEKYLIYPKENQPNICTYIDLKVKNKNLILYQPRIKNNGSLIFHLGSGHYQKNSTEINKNIKIR